jgi:hypothetical protein
MALPLATTKPAPSTSNRYVTLPKLFCRVLYDVLYPNLFSRRFGLLDARKDPAGNRALIKHLRQLFIHWRFALSALQAECLP